MNTRTPTAYAPSGKSSLASSFGGMTKAAIVSGVAVGVFLLIRLVARNFKKGIRQQQSLRPGDPAAYATQLQLAFENNSPFGWGTDEEAVFRIISQIPNRVVFQKTQRAYRDLFGTTLAAALKSELSSREYNQLLDQIHSRFK